MEAINTYSIAEMVIDEATEQFKNHWVVPEHKRNILHEACALIDRLVAEFDCESTEVEVDDATLKLTVSIVCPDVELEHGRTHPFFTLIQQIESFSFSTIEDSLKINFVFAGLWEKRD